MNVFKKTLVGTSMIREIQKNIEKVGFKIKDVQSVYSETHTMVWKLPILS